jgi:hypothetical protein
MSEHSASNLTAGYVNRALSDTDLDAFVNALAMRVASFGEQAIVETFCQCRELPPAAEIAPEWDGCIASIQRPAGQTRINKLLGRAFHKPGDVENRLGCHVGQLGSCGPIDTIRSITKHHGESGVPSSRNNGKRAARR